MKLMKKIFYTGAIAAAIFFLNDVKAQGFYTDVNIGYGWGLGESNLGMKTYDDFIEDGDTQEAIYGTLGGGLTIAVAPGYMINEYIGIELGVNYFVGEKKVINELTTSLDTRYDRTTANSNQLRILPTLFLRTGGDKFYAYSKSSLLVPVLGSTIGVREESKVDPINGVLLERTSTTTNGSFTVGFRGAIGMGYQITEMIGLNLEVAYTSLSIKPKNRTVDSYTINDTELIADFLPYVQDIEYVDQLNSSSNNSSYNSNFSMDKPKEELATKTNFSQIGVTLGVKISF